MIASAPDRDIEQLKYTSDKILYGRRYIAVNAASALFGNLAARIIGHAYQGYVTASFFRSAEQANVRHTTVIERSALVNLARAVGGQDWENASISADAKHIFIVTCGYKHRL